MDYCNCHRQNPADSIEESFSSLEYCLRGREGVLGGPAYEDAANHLISFSLSKIIATLSAFATPESCPPGRASSDTVLRASLRRFQTDPTSGNLLCYLNVAQRVGLNVYQIDETAWLASLDAILFNRFGRHLDSILLFGDPLDFISARKDILTKYPESDINEQALEEYKEPQITWTCKSQFGEACRVHHQNEKTALKCCAKQARRKKGWWLPHKIECQSLIYGINYICNCGAPERARARRPRT